MEVKFSKEFKQVFYVEIANGCNYDSDHVDMEAQILLHLLS